ncbi:MAG TPA: hypothetical protein VKY92_07505 [Verrucomicrobiae bacterium]|nr:hypothetical protein [Verrucomicrobiae bacterium]
MEGAVSQTPRLVDFTGGRAPERKWTQAEIEKYQRMRQRKLNNPVDFEPTGIWFPERSDAQLLDFISLVVVDNESTLSTVVDAAASNDNRFWAIGLAEAITAAKAVARRALYHGLRAAPGIEDEKEGRRREPMLLELHGFSGLMAYDDTRLLHHICSVLCHFREEILQIQKTLAGEPELRMAETMAIAELVEDRGRGLEEVEKAEETGHPTTLQQLVLTCKTRSSRVKGLKPF